MIHRFFSYSKKIHKILGLLAAIFVIYMSLTGILLNHKDLLAPYSVPVRFLPQQYQVINWNRSSLLDVCAIPGKKNAYFIAGKYGLFRYNRLTHLYRKEENGFPKYALWRRTYDLLHVRNSKEFILAGTEKGLYYFNPQDNSWRQIFPDRLSQKIIKLYQIDSTIYIFSDSQAYQLSGSENNFKLNSIELPRENSDYRVSLVKLFFDWHDGSVFGIKGRLFYDMIGLIFIFLSISGIVIWFFPKWHKKNVKRNSDFTSRFKNFFHFNFKKHNQFGIWFGLFLFIISFTAFFMRPPALAAIARGHAPQWMYPGMLPDNPWAEKIRNVVYLPDQNQILIDAEDGFWYGTWPFPHVMKLLPYDLPVFVMGSTSLSQISDSTLLIASFNGLMEFNFKSGLYKHLLSSDTSKHFSTTIPADTMITSFIDLDSITFLTAHEQGLLNISSLKTAHLPSPNSFIQFEMPLWNVIFEIHNGRIFKDLLGGFYILIIPLGSLMCILIILSGIFDWFHRRRGFKRRKT